PNRVLKQPLAKATRPRCCTSVSTAPRQGNSSRSACRLRSPLTERTGLIRCISTLLAIRLRLHSCPGLLPKQCQDLLQFAEHVLQLCHRVSGQILWIWQFVRVLSRLLLQPLEPVQLDLPLPHFADVERPPAVLGRCLRPPLRPAVRVGPEALLEF